MNDFWIVCQNVAGREPHFVWEFQGLFDSERRARAACLNRNYWMAQVAVNETLPDETVMFRRSIYPNPRESERMWGT